VNSVLRFTAGFFAATPMPTIRLKPHFIEQPTGGLVRCHSCLIGKSGSCGNSNAARITMSVICRVARTVLEWLALIQHYGGPTRLLDFSYSFYLAAFFAMEKPKRREAAAIWAVNDALLAARIAAKFEAKWPPKNYDRMNLDHIAFANDFLARKREPEPFVISVAPERMNERLSIQQGLFLVPCDISSPFEQNLAATFSLDPEALRSRDIAPWKGGPLPEQTALLRIRLPRHLHTKALRDLHAMNVTSASLFPGLDGFARSLYHEIRLMSER